MISGNINLFIIIIGFIKLPDTVLFIILLLLLLFTRLNDSVLCSDPSQPVSFKHSHSYIIIIIIIILSSTRLVHRKLLRRRHRSNTIFLMLLFVRSTAAADGPSLGTLTTSRTPFLDAPSSLYRPCHNRRSDVSLLLRYIIKIKHHSCGSCNTQYPKNRVITVCCYVDR